MAENSKIEWTHHTFNPWVGCQKVSPGCDNYYAEQWALRCGRDFSVPTKTSAANWKAPLKWNRKAAAAGVRERVFCASLGDVFDNRVPVQWRVELFRLIVDTPNLDWLFLTKRIGNAEVMIEQAWEGAMSERLPQKTAPWPWSNVWLGITVCNQAEADRDLMKLYAVPAHVRFLSIEPMLGPISLDCWPVYGEDEKPLLHWVIVGGESGHNARPMNVEWARSLRDQCKAAGVPFMLKQWGSWLPASLGHYGNSRGTWHNGHFYLGYGDIYSTEFTMERVSGKPIGYRLLDGVLHDDYPEART